MRDYIDERTQAIKYDLYFSDKQIKTGYVENGTFVPFTHNRQIDKNTGEKMVMYRIALRDADHRSFRFQNEGLNSQSCFIQVPAASVRRKVKGLTSVYTVTTAWKDSWNLTVYAGDINAKSAWSGLKEKIGLEALSQCLEYQGLEKGVEDPQAADQIWNETKIVEQNPEQPQVHDGNSNVATLPQTEKEAEVDEIDRFFPKNERTEPVERVPQDSSVAKSSGELIKVVELLMSQNQQMIQQVGQLANAMTQMMEQQAVVSAKLSEAVESHQETKSLFSTVKGWLKQVTSRTQQMSKDVSEVKEEIESSKGIKTPIKEQNKER